jgi:transposase
MKTAQELQQEVIDLRAEIHKKDTQIELRNTQIKKQSDYITNLESALKDLKKHRFGSKSERANKDQLPLFNEAEQIADSKPPKKVVGKKNKAGKRKALPKDLLRISQDHDLDENQKTCPHDGSKLKHIGEVITEQLYFKPAIIKVIEHKQYKYACSCGKHIVTAKKPKELIPKSIATPELLSYITISKYADALPLYRLSGMFKRIQAHISRQVMSNWMIKCAKGIQPLVNLIRDELYNQPCIHMDETTIQVLKEPGKKASNKSYMWVQRGGDNIIFDYQDNRSAKIVEQLLANYKGAIMTDGYKTYDAVAKSYGITHLGCWVHARRYFIKVLDDSENTNASKMIDLIGKLYGIEKQIKGKDPDIIYKKRQEYAKPILIEIRAFLDEILHTTLPKGRMGEALGYLHKQWHKLIGYIDDGNYPIDNNTAENAIRPFVIGRKNWLFANTPSGAQASANIYSLIETAKAHGLNVYDYFAHIYKMLPLVESIDDYENLLPKNFKSG